MSKFYDNENLLEIEMVDKNGTRFENEYDDDGELIAPCEVFYDIKQLGVCE